MMPHCILNHDICIAMSHSKYMQSELSLKIRMVGGIVSSVFMYLHFFFFTVSSPDPRPERDRAKSEFMNRDIAKFFN